jgi:uncharacterized membrane protein
MSGKTAAAKPARLWLQGAVCGILAAVVPGIACMLGVLLLPGLLIYATESTPGRPVARAMLLMGAAAVIMPMRTVWAHGMSLAAALDVLGDPAVPLLAWTAGGAGWLLIEVADIVATYIGRAKDRSTARRLEEERAALGEEWTDVL